MKRTQTPATALANRLCRPQRIGVFGHRGAGKTTLLTVLYREAVGGRLPGLRLAAADARTANYLSDKVLQLESGQPLPATLGETELRFHLYRQGARADLLVMDYQGEHVAIGREEPVRDFLRECDAVWLCLDVPSSEPAARLRTEQEVEQLVEDYLNVQDPAAPHRPMALVLTKADLLGPPDGPPDTAIVQELAGGRFRMTRHALESHCPWYGLFAVSSLGGPLLAPPPAELADPADPPAFEPRPSGLGGPLCWLAEVLQTQDQARLDRLWELAPHDLALLGRCTTTFARRYPDAAATKAFQQRLREAQRRLRLRRVVGVLAATVALCAGLWAYDFVGERRAAAFAAQHADDPVAVRQHWHSYRAWHPTRHLLRPAAARAEEVRLHALDEVVLERQREQRLADLRRRADDPDADAEAVWGEFQRFREDFPEHSVDSEWQAFRARLEARRDTRVAQREREERGERERRALLAFRDLERAEQGKPLLARVELADRFLRDHAGTSRVPEVEQRRLAALRRLDQHDVEAARDYSARNPLNFYTRRQRYQQYLDAHPRGAYVSEASGALKAIAVDWDRYDFRAVRDRYQAKPGDVKELKVLCRAYLAAHPEGKFRPAARDLLRWSERVTAPGEYKVVLKSGSFDKSAAHMLSRGTSLSVAIEVGGVRYGPSTIVKRNYEPEWNYEFPRRVRWKLGDGVRIYVTDHYFWRRQVLEVGSDEDDLLALRLLSGEVNSGPHRLTFESDFRMPTMPKIE